MGAALCVDPLEGGKFMKKVWTKPQVCVQEAGLEVTAYVAAALK
jgi:coenzyme PQQ precursor peptide PqqA